MQDALRNRVFAVVTIAAMLLGSLSAVLAPATASAASAGDLIKNESLSTVYYYAPDGERYTFPDEKTYMTWYQDFDSVETISDSDLADIALGGNIVYRPGTYWIKVQSDPKVYAVSTDGMLHWIETEDVAVDYAGSDWASHVQDVPDVFFTNYTSGTSLTSATAYDGMMYMDGSDYYIAWDGEKRMVSDLDANNMTSDFYLMGEGIDDSALTAGDEITGSVAAIVDASQQGGVEEVVEVAGDVEVSLSSSNPTGITVPYDTNSVDVLEIDFTAGDEATEVTQVAVSMIGLSTATDVSDVYLYEGSTRLTESRSVNSSTRKATFGSLGLELDAGETRTVTVRVTLNASGGEEIQFGLDSVDDIEADGDVSGSFPLEGDVFEASTQAVGDVVIIDTGSIDDPYLGQADAVVGKFKISPSGEDATVQALTLKVDNSADHSDFKLWVDGDQVATGEYIGDKLVSFELDEAVTILDGSNETFELSADIGGEAADNLYVYMEKTIDVDIIGGDYDFPMDINIDGYDNSDSTERNSSTVQGGDVTFALSGPTAGDIQTNSSDQVLLEFTLTTAQDITVKDMDVIVYGDDNADNDPFDGTEGGTDADATGLIGNGEAHLTDIKIVNAETGATIMGPLELDGITSSDDDADQTIDFTDDFEMEAGETLTLQVTADIDDSMTSGTEFGAAIDLATPGFVAEDSNGDTISTGIVPSTNIQGYSQTATAAGLTISLASTPGDVTTIQGMSDVLVNSFNFVAADAGDLLVTDIVLSTYGDDTSSSTHHAGGDTNADVNDFISSCSLYDMSGTLLDGPESPATNGESITFSSVDWELAAGVNDRLDVYCNFANPTSATATDYFSFDLATVADDVAVEDSEGTDVDPTGDAVNGGTSPTNVVTLNEAGTIAVAVDSGTPSADFVLTNTTDNHVASYRITATNEDFEVSVFSLNEQAATDDSTAAASDYTNNISLVTIEYPLEDGTTGTATATMNAEVAKFSLASEPIFVGVDDPAIVDVYVDVPTTDRNSGGSATSNEQIRMAFYAGDDSGADHFKAVGAGSGTTLGEDATGLDAVATGMATYVVRETKPTVSLSSSSPSGTAVPGDIEVYRFNVSAASNEDLVLEQFGWQMSSTNNADTTTPIWNECDTNALAADVTLASEFDFYNLSEEGTATALDVDADWKLYTDYSGSLEACGETAHKLSHVVLDLTTPEIVPAGETYTYSLYLDTTGASAASDDVIYFTLVSDPLSATYIDSTEDTTEILTATDTVVDISDHDAASPTLWVGDVVQVGADTERMLITAINSTTDDITVVRGYLGTTPGTPGTGDVNRMPTTFGWQDDGTTAMSNDDAWGSYLVDSLPVTGSSLQF